MWGDEKKWVTSQTDVSEPLFTCWPIKCGPTAELNPKISFDFVNFEIVYAKHHATPENNAKNFKKFIVHKCPYLQQV